MIRCHFLFAFLPLIFLAASSLLGAPPAQQPPQPKSGAQGTYTLDQTVRAVVLDAAVTDRQGKPVPNLTAADFTVTEDGVPQHVDFFQDISEHKLPAKTVAADRQGAALVKSAGEAPLTILLLDHVSTEPEDLAYAKREIATYLRKQPAALNSPTALMALTGSSLLTLCDYTLDRDKLVAGIAKDHDTSSWYVLRDRQAGMKSTNLETSGERLAIYVGVLNELANAIEPYPVRKNIVWVGPGLPALDQVLAVQSDTRREIQENLRNTVTRLIRARVTMYTVDPQGLLVAPTEIAMTHSTPGGSVSVFTPGGDPSEGELAFEQLAPRTGGKIFRMCNDVAVEIGESVSDGEHYYTLSYYPTDKHYDGKFRRIRVQVRDPNLVVRTREGYIASPPSRPTGDAAAQALEFALTSNLRYQGIEVAAHFDQTTSPRSLRVVVDTGDLQWMQDGSAPQKVATVSVVSADVNRDGKVLHYKVDTMHARAAAAATENGKADFAVPVTIDPKAALVRVVVRDQATGHIGSFDLPLQ